MKAWLIWLLYGGPTEGTRRCDCLKEHYWCDCCRLEEDASLKDDSGQD